VKNPYPKTRPENPIRKPKKMNTTIDIFLPKVIISSLDTVDSMKQKIANTVANMGIGTIDLFDLNFSKKHMNHYGFITILLSNTDTARRFVRDIEDRGFAKLTDKDHYWRVCRYIALEKRRALDTAFIQEDCECEEEEEEEEAPDWEEPNEDAPYEFGFAHSVANAFDASSTLDASAIFDTSTYDFQILELLSFEDDSSSTDKDDSSATIKDDVNKEPFDMTSIFAFESANAFGSATNAFGSATNALGSATNAFEPSLEMPVVDVPNCDYTIYTNWRNADNLLNPIMASRIFPNITLLDVVDDQWAPMPIPNLLIGVNNGMYETSFSKKWMDWM
jgi:hypothetical protein